jgi:hypothetical protein
MSMCVRLESASFAMTMPRGMEDECKVSLACNASNNCAVYESKKIRGLYQVLRV